MTRVTTGPLEAEVPPARAVPAAAEPPPGAWHSTAQPLGRRQVHAIAGCYFVASFAALGLPPHLTAILPGLGDPTARWAGLLYVVPTVCGALGAPLWGRLADRFGHKPLLLRAQLGLALSFALAGAAHSLPLFAAALALQGLLGGTYAASSGYVAAGLADGQAVSRALTLMQGAARASLVAAPVVVGALAPWLPPHRQYLVMAALPLAAALLLTALPAPARGGAPAPVDPAPAAGPPGAVEGAAGAGPAAGSAVGSLAPPWRLYALEFAFVFATVVSFPYLLALVQERLAGASGAVGGLLFAVPHLCYLTAALPVHPLVSRRPRAGVGAGFAAVGLALAAHAAAGSLATLVAARVLFGAGLTLGLVGLSVLAAQAAAGRPPGRMFGWLELVSKGGAVASGLAATAAHARWGPTGPVLAGAAAAATAALLMSLTALASRRTTAHPIRDRWSRS